MPGIDPRRERVVRPTNLGFALLVVMVASWLATGFDESVFIAGWVAWAVIGLVVTARELDF
jgi:hypothetical protein